MSMIGSTVGNYQVVEMLGRGGMAEVYKAYHAELNVFRAIKFIRPEFVRSDDFRVRFQREARAIEQLDHPYIIRIYDFGVHEKMYYMVMQFVDGDNLKDLLAEQGPIEAEQALTWVTQIADALAYAHARDVIHRDIKPENIMLSTDGQVKLMDFGIAKLLNSDTQLTQTGVGIGTPAYMAPEQATAESVTASTDVYALSIVLFELLTGQQPFKADTPIAVIVKAINDPLPMPRAINPNIDQRIEAIIVKGTSKDPNNRYADANEFLQALSNPNHPAVTDAATITTNSQARASEQTTPESTSSNSMKIWLVLLLVTVIGAVYWFANEQPGAMPAKNGTVAPTETQKYAEPSGKREDDRPPKEPAEITEEEQLTEVLERNIPISLNERPAKVAEVKIETPLEKPAVNKAPPVCSPGDAAGCFLAGSDKATQGDIKGALDDYASACKEDFLSACIAARDLQGKSENPAAKPAEPKETAPTPKVSEARTKTPPAQARSNTTKRTLSCSVIRVEDCKTMAQMYIDGNGVSKDLARAVESYSTACYGGASDVCVIAGESYYQGQVVPKDLKKASGLFNIGCKASVGKACGYIGIMSKNGDGIKKSKLFAVTNFEKGCQFNDGQSCTNLGFAYLNGTGARANPSIAAQHFEKGCRLNSGAGCVAVGGLYLEGKGVRRNRSAAREFFRKGCDAGNQHGCDLANR